MKRIVLLGVCLIAAAISAVAFRKAGTSPHAAIYQPAATQTELAPLCPWRDPERDLRTFFPAADRFKVETRILSGKRVELTQRLGRAPTGDENALQVYRIYGQAAPLGMVLARRVKGSHGAIEFVLATDNAGAVTGLQLQRLREPEEIAVTLQDAVWRRSFQGASALSDWKLEETIRRLPPDAQASARAIVDGARTATILLAVSETSQLRKSEEHDHH